MRYVGLDEARTQLWELIEATLKGEKVYVLREDRKAVQLVPASLSLPRPRFGSAKGKITIAPDFDAPLDDMQEYTA
jgi:antitoxin (DNA-binding transcriptional repressor) of toxin-antitoxin stability system